MGYPHFDCDEFNCLVRCFHGPENTETITFTAKDINDSGYSTTLPVITLVIKDQVTPTAAGQLNTPGVLVLPTCMWAITTICRSVSRTWHAPLRPGSA